MTTDVAAEIGIEEASGPVDMAQVRAPFRAYADELDFDLCFQDFDAELANLPGAYAPLRGCILLARAGGMDGAPEGGVSPRPLGVVALRPLGEDTCEMKRLYVAPSLRGKGAGRRLAEAILDAARAAGYGVMRLDTVASMSVARALYADLGFRECAPYYDNPLEGVIYMEKDLRREL